MPFSTRCPLWMPPFQIVEVVSYKQKLSVLVLRNGTPQIRFRLLHCSQIDNALNLLYVFDFKLCTYNMIKI